MTELQPGRIPMTDTETKALDALIEEHGAARSLTRRDPEETGPVIVDFDGRRFQIDANGRKRDLNG